MNRADARSPFLSRARGNSESLTLTEAKDKFRKAAADLDDAIGLRDVDIKWRAPFSLLSRFFSSTTVQAWLLPLVTNIIRLSSNVIDAVFGASTRGSKRTRQTRKRKR